MKKTSLLSKSTILISFLFPILISCRIETNPRVSFLEANYFTPLNPKSGDLVTVVGRNLEDFSVLINGVPETEIDVEDHSFTFILKEDLNQSIIINAPTEQISLSPNNVLISDAIQQILLTDFDGNGIRSASAEETLDRSFWESTTTETSNLSTSEETNGFFHLSASKDRLSVNNDIAFAGDLLNLNTLEHNRQDIFGANFFEYKGNTIPFPDTQEDLDNFYISFRVNFNSNLFSQLKITMDNDVTIDSLKPAFELEFESNRTEGNGNNQNTALYDSEWHQVIIPFSSFSTNFGFDPQIQINNSDILFSLQNFNRIKFVLADNFDNNRTGREDAFYQKVEVNLDDIKILFTEADLTPFFPHEYKKDKIFLKNGPAWYD